MQMAANPSLMREMTRNADRAMGQLNTMPGGMNALQRAHEDFADPLYAALSGQDGADGVAGMNSYEQETQGLPNNEALPNPWGAPTPASPATSPAPAQQRAQAVTVSPGNGMPVANPLAQMMQSTATPGEPGAVAATSPANPFGAMMQQMMSNPEQMQQMMGLSQQIMGGVNGPAANPFGQMMQSTAAPGEPGATPAAPAANPFGPMMQQLMSNPEQMQQMMRLSQQMMAGVNGPAANPFAQMMQSTAAPDEPGAALGTPGAFSSQLVQLSAMGFTNQAACLQALRQHNGRVDAAVDTLLNSGGDSA